MSLAEFKEWIAFDRISPIGDERYDILAAVLTSTVAASAGVDIKAKDATIRWWKPPITAAQLDRKLDMAFGMMMSMQKARKSE